MTPLQGSSWWKDCRVGYNPLLRLNVNTLLQTLHGANCCAMKAWMDEEHAEGSSTCYTKQLRSFGLRGTSYNMLTTSTTRAVARDNVLSTQRNNGFKLRDNEEHQHHRSVEVLNSSVQELTAKATEYIVDQVNARHKLIRFAFPMDDANFIQPPEGTPPPPAPGEQQGARRPRRDATRVSRVCG